MARMIDRLTVSASRRTWMIVAMVELPDEIRTIFAEKKHNQVPVVVGSNANEMTSLNGPALVPKSRRGHRTIRTANPTSSSATPCKRGITC
jgi:hypothetical protein